MSLTRESLTQGAAASRAQARGAWRHGPILAALALALAAWALRLWAVGQSLPYVDHPDEPNPIDYVVDMLRTGDPNQHFFQKPSLYVYMLLTVLGAHYRWGLTSGLYGELGQMYITTHTVTTIPGFFFWGRVLTATIGGLTVLGVWRLGAQCWSRAAGLIGALFVATAPFHVRFSRYVTTDVASAWLVLLAFGGALTVLKGGRWRAYLVAGMFAGLAASTKYNAGVVALAIVAAHGLHWQRRALGQLPRLLAGAAAAMVGFFVGTPYALLSWREVFGGIAGQWNAYQGDGGGGHLQGSWNVGGYAGFFWNDGLHPAACLATLVGLWLLLRFHPKIGLLWLCFALPSLLLHLAMTSHFMQNMLPLIVLCALPVGVAAAAAIDWLRRWTPRYWPIGASLLLAALLLAPTLQTLRLTWQQSRGDTRVQAIGWLEVNAPPGVRVAAELKPVPNNRGAGRWTEVDQLIQHDLRRYRQHGYRYLIASSKRWGQLALPAAYTGLLGRSPLAEFGSYQGGELLGPHLFIYDTGLSAEDIGAIGSPTPPQTQIGGARFLGVTIGPFEQPEAREDPPPTRRFKAGDIVGLRTFWQVEQPFTSDYFVFVHVLDAAGSRVAQRDTPPWQGDAPTSSWQPGSLVVDINDIFLPPTLPPGEYRLVVGMFDPATGARPATLVNNLQQGAGEIDLGTIVIEP